MYVCVCVCVCVCPSVHLISQIIQWNPVKFNVGESTEQAVRGMSDLYHSNITCIITED